MAQVLEKDPFAALTAATVVENLVTALGSNVRDIMRRGLLTKTQCEALVRYKVREIHCLVPSQGHAGEDVEISWMYKDCNDTIAISVWHGVQLAQSTAIAVLHIQSLSLIRDINRNSAESMTSLNVPSGVAWNISSQFQKSLWRDRKQLVIQSKNLKAPSAFLSFRTRSRRLLTGNEL